MECQGTAGLTCEAEEGDGAATEAEVGVQEEHSHTPFEPRGEIDEGEVNEEVLRQYEMEAGDDERGLQEDPSDDEDDPLVPRTGTITISHSSLSILVRMCPGSIERIRFVLAPCIRVQSRSRMQ